MSCQERHHFYLYSPAGGKGLNDYFLSRLPGVKPVSLEVFEEYRKQFDDLGELNPDYHGFKTLVEKYILLLTGRDDQPCGYCVYGAEKAGLIGIDIILVKKELRRKGYGRTILGYLEQSCPPGTVFYVDHVTSAGRKFFVSCGFARDVDLFKVLSAHNRICAWTAAPVKAVPACV
ncbi:GNAT family N-acetyltransferase [Desulfotomaculum copahuensis]|uniref:N-acetyltransferase domain-containing protein n=1 Tax=Desulfotomaculum copahuensis TaxID=1838280 RepID=A0A1B7LF48_9FIRM|nr:GNAT family N-acetyltransferase [Desulfotomaculum copahuensis]OAT82257.1 hypothetical protein A6M21_08835 [Desulfotomaculum copahuensis]